MAWQGQRLSRARGGRLSHSVMIFPRRNMVLGAVTALFMAFGAADAQQVPAQDSSPAIQPPQSAFQAPAIPLDAYSSVGSDMALANHLNELGWSEAQITAFIEGIRAALHGKPFPATDAARQVSDTISKRVAEIEAQEREQEFAKPGRLKEYLRDICKRMKLDESDSGLCYAISSVGSGVRPGPDDTVVVSCAAFAADLATPLPQLTNQKARTKVSDMLPGFVEGIQMMTVGSSAIFILPPALSFGKGDWPPGVDRGTPLIFRITLNEVVSANSPR
jgi:FKBP-type peptidyl-prolyl cis-trans isomerase FkpA